MCWFKYKIKSKNIFIYCQFVKMLNIYITLSLKNLVFKPDPSIIALYALFYWVTGHYFSFIVKAALYRCSLDPNTQLTPHLCVFFLSTGLLGNTKNQQATSENVFVLLLLSKTHSAPWATVDGGIVFNISVLLFSHLSDLNVPGKLYVHWSVGRSLFIHCITKGFQSWLGNWKENTFSLTNGQ